MTNAGMAESERTKQSGASEGDRFSQLIREEVRAAVYEFVPQADEPPSYNHPAIELERINSPMAIETGSRLDDTPAAEGSPFLGLTNDQATKSQDVGRATPLLRRLVFRMPLWLEVVIGLAPIASVFVMMPLISTSGADVLFINVVAFFLLIAAYGTTAIQVTIAAVLSMVATKQNANRDKEEDDETDTAQNKDTESTFSLLFFGYHFLAIYLTFGLILWLFFVSTRSSLIAQGLVAARFQAKVAVRDGLFVFTECLEAQAAGRSATYDDFTSCLSALSLSPNPKMGM